VESYRPDSACACVSVCVVCVCCVCVVCVCVGVLRIDCVLSVIDCSYDKVHENGCRRFRVNKHINTSFKQTVRS
jgi:hypothetical protein